MDPRAGLRTFLVAAVLAVVALALAGCGGDSGDEVGKEDGEIAAPEGGQRSLAVAEEPPPNPDRLSTEAAAGDDAGIDFEEYNADLEAMVALLDEYWEAVAREEGEESYGPPEDVIAYSAGEEDAPECAGEPAAPENAFYCSENEIIAWDDPGLFIPYYRDKGDAAVGIILAHEWGHLIQQRLGVSQEYLHTIESELAADCLAGAWLAALDDQGLLDGVPPGEGGDIDEALDSIFSLGDTPDTPFEDPDAHGTGEERVEAVATGYDGELDGCETTYPPGFTEEPGSDVEPSDAPGDALGGGFGAEGE